MDHVIRTSTRSWQRQRVSSCIRIACALMLAEAAAGPYVAWAQVAQVGNNGQALDASPMVGSGGSNRPSQGYTGYVPGRVNGNDIITGNVAGLGYFHGNIPYSSPYSFQAALPSSSLSNFARQSAPLVMPTNNAQSIYRPYYLPSQTVTTSTPYGMAAAARPTGNGYDSNFGLSPYGNYATNLSQPLATLPNLNPRHPADLDLPYRDYSDISVPQYAPMLSNLYGLRQGPITQQEFLSGKYGANAPANPTGKDKNEKERKQYGDEPDTTTIRTDIGVTQRIKGATTNKAIDQELVQVPQAQPENQFVGQTNKPKPEETTSDAFQGLVAEVDKAQEQRLALAPKTASTNVVDNATWRMPQILDANGQPTGRYATLMPNRRPGETAEPIGPLLEPGGTVAKGPRENQTVKTQSDNPAGQGYRPKSYVSDEDPLTSRAILQAGRKVKSLVTLVGKTNSTFNGVMSQGEAAMKEGAYLRAAEVYQGAIALEPENGLAVVGRAHAELAAGLYESGAYDLKFLFHRHPELMAVHYDLPAFMSPKRLDFVSDDVRALARKGVPAASFLVCYLDYQEQRQDKLVEDFADWYSRHPNDPWGPVVEKAWVEKDATSDKPAPNP